MTRPSFMGYARPDGSAGARNHVVVIPTVACANGVAGLIEKNVPGVVALRPGHGCGRALEIGMHQAALAGLGKNPNVAGAVVIGLGCETVNASVVIILVGSSDSGWLTESTTSVPDGDGAALRAGSASGAGRELATACGRRPRSGLAFTAGDGVGPAARSSWE